MCGERGCVETCKTSASLRASALLFVLLTSKILLQLATSLTVGGGLCLKLSLGQIMPNPNICDHSSIYNFHDGVFSKRKIRMGFGQHFHNPIYAIRHLNKYDHHIYITSIQIESCIILTSVTFSSSLHIFSYGDMDLSHILGDKS